MGQNEVLGVVKIPNGPWQENCYVLYNKTREALIFDPGSEESVIAGLIDEHDLKPMAILNTHAHYDHVGAVAALMERYDIPFYLHSGDKRLLLRANLYAAIFDGEGPVTPPKQFEDLKLMDNLLSIGPFDVEIVYTPGHTEGSVCFLIEGHCLVGDTLFYKNIGRIDLPGGNKPKLMQSLKRISELDGNTIIYPGHGRNSTVAAELAHNHKFQEAVNET